MLPFSFFYPRAGRIVLDDVPTNDMSLHDLSQRIAIAHRLAIVQKADIIVVLDQGQLVEQGTHAQLVARGGVYAGLAVFQFDA